jgi:hypothetical protein
MANVVLAADQNAIGVSVRKDSTAGGLNVRSPLLAGDNFDFRSCEAVLYGDTSTPLFQVKVSSDTAAPGAHWSIRDNTYSYTWKYAEGIQVDFAATPENDSLKLRYTLTNHSPAVLSRVLVHTCVPTTEAPSFFPPAAEREGKDRHGKPVKLKVYLGLYDRTFFWSQGKQIAFSQTELGKNELHLAFTRQGTPPVKWAWWVNGPETFDVPLIAVASKDGRFTAGLGFQDGLWATVNASDDRACFHLFPHFGALKPGQSATVEGRFYLLKGTPNDVLAQFRSDFSLATPGTQQKPAGGKRASGTISTQGGKGP